MTENTVANTEVVESDVEKIKAQARAAADKRLREAHADEYREFMAEEHASRGVEYRPRLSKDERARQEIERLAREHGIALSFDVTGNEDVQANVRVAQAAHESAVQDGPLPLH